MKCPGCGAAIQFEDPKNQGTSRVRSTKEGSKKEEKYSVKDAFG